MESNATANLFSRVIEHASLYQLCGMFRWGKSWVQRVSRRGLKRLTHTWPQKWFLPVYGSRRRRPLPMMKKMCINMQNCSAPPEVVTRLKCSPAYQLTMKPILIWQSRRPATTECEMHFRSRQSRLPHISKWAIHWKVLLLPIIRFVGFGLEMV